MHDQSASRISGRTRTAVSAMCVRALRITVLKSAGNFTRDECHDLNAEKIQRVKCFLVTRSGICCVLAIFERRRGRLGSKISGYGQLAEVAVYFAMSGLLPGSENFTRQRRRRRGFISRVRTCLSARSPDWHLSRRRNRRLKQRVCQPGPRSASAQNTSRSGKSPPL
jgi:hypothetical protein